MSSATIALPNSAESGLDRSLLYASSVLADPFCKAYELVRYRLLGPLDADKFNNLPLIQEIAFRALIAVGTIATLYIAFLFPITFLVTLLTVGVTIKLLRCIGFACQKNDYTHVQTSAPEIPLGRRTTIAMQNFCGMEGGMHYDRGGVTDWKSRIDEFTDLLRRKRPHVIILQEIYTTTLAEALVEKLGDIYPHFFMHLGANVMGVDGGLMMITDHPVDAFSNISFKNNDWTCNRSFAAMDIGNIQIIGTHLIDGEDRRKDRKQQFDQILDFVANQGGGKITIIGADFNLERDGEEGQEILTPYLEHGYREDRPTCTGKLIEQWNGEKGKEELIDNISQVRSTYLIDGRRLDVFDEFRIEEVELLAAYDDTYNTKTARSDHHGMMATVLV